MLFAAAAWPATSIAAAGLVPQYSESLRPALKFASKAGVATLDFTAFGRDFRLQLASNERLAQLAADSSVQLYKGTIEGAPGSWARITVQDGLPRGMIWDGRELFVIEAAPEAVNDGAAGTVMFKLSDAVLERGVWFGDDAVDVPRDAAEAYGSLIGELQTTTPALKAGEATQKVDMSILADAAFLARFSSETQARDAILTRLNNVDGIFSSQLGVELQVASVEIAGEHTTGLSATTDPSKLLEEVGQLRRRMSALSATGLTHLITGRKFEGNTAGIAYTTALCSPRYAASVTMVHNSIALDTLIMAHEIGHVFGAPHDGVEKCASMPQGQFIMTPTLDTSVTSFSQCSLDRIEAVIDSYACVVALPPPSSESPTAPAAPAPSPVNNGGGEGGGGSLDPALLLFLLLSQAARLRHRGRSPI